MSPYDTTLTGTENVNLTKPNGDAFALKFEAVVIERARDVDCQHKSRIRSV
jgi:hypothetical protein